MKGRARSIRADRRYALLALYQFDSGLAGDLESVRAALEAIDELGDDGEGVDLSLASARLVARAPARLAARGGVLGAGPALRADVGEFRNDADRAVRPYTADWPVHRQPGLDRNALRLGWYGFAHAGDPPALAIDEAIELAKTFSTEKSGAFVNAVLDRVAKESLGGDAGGAEPTR